MDTTDQNPYSEGTLGSVRWKREHGVPLSDEEQHQANALREAIAAMLHPPMFTFFDDHPSAVTHVNTVGAGALVWCTNCGPWIDDDAWVDAETLLDQPISEFMQAVLDAESTLALVDRCELCKDQEASTQKPESNKDP